MRRLVMLASLVFVAVACSDIVSPLRLNTYEFRREEPNGTGVDQLAFHWPASMLPVRVWVADNDSLARHLPEAISRWEGVFLYGEFSAVIVSDSNQADVVIRNGVSDMDGTGIGARAPQCDGETNYGVVGPQVTFRLPIHVFIAPHGGPATPGLATCYNITLTHELGHAIGLLSHSGDSGDVMFGNPVFDGISERDRNTAQVAYHTQATWTPVGRR